MKAYRLSGIEQKGSTQSAYLLPAHLFSLCSPTESNKGISSPQWYSQWYSMICKERVEERERWRKHVRKKTRRKQRNGGCIQSCSAHELWHLWQRYPLFSDTVLTAPAHSFPLTRYLLEISHSLSHNEALLCLTGTVSWFHDLLWLLWIQ